MLFVSAPPTPVDTRNEVAFILQISGAPESVTSAAAVEVNETIPESFLAGWADYQAGRVVDMERALGEEPPPVV